MASCRAIRTSTLRAAERYTFAIDSLSGPPTSEEALALLDLFPSDESTSFGLAWSILHLVESSPYWPVRSALDDRNWWVTQLRERAERADSNSPV